MLPNRMGGGFERSAHPLGQPNGVVLSRIWQQGSRTPHLRSGQKDHSVASAKSANRQNEVSTSSPAWCPYLSLMLLKRSRSKMMRAVGSRAKRARINSRSPLSKKPRRLGVLLHGRGAGERTRGEGRVHASPRPRARRDGARGRRARSGSRRRAEAPRARRALPRHRQDRRPVEDHPEARPADEARTHR